MIFNFRKREHAIAEAEKTIQAGKKELHSAIDQDIKKLQRIKKVMSNGVSFRVYQAMGGGHHGS